MDSSGGSEGIMYRIALWAKKAKIAPRLKPTTKKPNRGTVVQSKPPKLARITEKTQAVHYWEKSWLSLNRKFVVTCTVKIRNNRNLKLNKFLIKF